MSDNKVNIFDSIFDSENLTNFFDTIWGEYNDNIDIKDNTDIKDKIETKKEDKGIKYQKAELLKDTVFSNTKNVYKLIKEGAEVFIKEYVNNDIVCISDGAFCTAYVSVKDIKPVIEINAPVMYGIKFRPYDMDKTEKDCMIWQFGYYLGDNKIETVNNSSVRPDYIVPFEKFNTKDIEANKEWIN